MKKSPTTPHDEESIVLDADSGEEIVAEEAGLVETSLKEKLKHLRAELAEAKRERDENLAGWQRAKADLVNYRRMAEEDRARDAKRAKISLAQALISGLDSFESAMASPTWREVSDEWREGIERVHGQMLKALGTEGLTAFGAPGETFDPIRHECMSVVPATDANPPDTVVQILQKGYTLGDEVVRPAKVIVAQHH